MPAVGDRLAGRYEIRAVTANRPTGLLYRGYDDQIGVEVALGLIDAELLPLAEERQAFVQRTARGKTLQHPNLMRLYDVLLDGAAVFLVMQWAPGERLSRRLAGLSAGVALPSLETRGIIRRAAAGIAHAHQHGVVLGSLRADTVMLYPDGLKLTNVGITTALPRARFLAALTARGALGDLAPELRGGADGDERADVYALASLAQRLVAGVLEQAPAARQILARALSVEPAQRPRDIEAFARELDAALEGRIDAPPSSPSVPTGHDTERVPRLPPSPTAADRSNMPALAVPPPDPDLERMERVREGADAWTVPQRKRAKAIELDADELVEVEAGAPLATLALEDDARTAAHLRLGPQPPAPAPPPSPKSPSPSPIRSASAREPEDDAATLQRPRLEPEEVDALDRAAAHSMTQPALPAVPPRSSALLLFVLLSAVGVGAIGTIFALHLGGERAARRLPPVPPASPHTAPPAVTSLPVPAVAPHTASVPAVLAPSAGPCPLGMAALPGAHPFCIDQYEYPGGHTIPRTQIRYNDAAQICAGRALRLCTDSEWEQACRGPARGSYPYGTSYDPPRCNTGGRGTAATIEPAGARARCRSAAGVYDMSGNVAEWTASAARRGGSAFSPQVESRCSHAVRGADSAGAADLGFRCCGPTR